MQLTVRDAMALEPLRTAVVAGGVGALDRTITWVQEREVLRDPFMLPSGILLLSRGHGLRDPAAAARFLAAASSAGCSAVIVAAEASGEPDLPRLASLADDLGLPLLTLEADQADDLPAELARALLAPEAVSSEGLFARVEALPLEDGYADAAAQIGRSLGCSVLIVNRLRKVMGSFESEEGAPLTLYVDLLGRTAGLERIFRSRPLVTISPGSDPDVAPLVVVPITFDESIHGALAIAPSVPVDAAMTAALDEARRALGLHFFRARLDHEHDETGLRGLTESLLSETPGLDLAARRRLMGLGYDLDRPWRVVLLRLSPDEAPDDAEPNIETVSLVRQLLKGDHSSPLVVADPAGVTILKQAHPEGPAAEVEVLARLREELATRMPSVRLWMVAGGPVDVGDVDKSLQQAEHALDVARIQDDGGALLTFEDLGIDRLLLDLVRSPRAIAWVIDVLRPILAYDQRKKSPLLQRTLETYLSLDCNADRAAEKLYLHPNTVRYRLRVVEDLTGRQLNVQEHRTVFHVALRFLSLMPADPASVEQEPVAAGFPG